MEQCQTTSVSKILVPLYEGENIVIAETDGSETIAKARMVFDGYIDPDFKKRNINVPSGPTKAQAVLVYEVHGDVRFSDMFSYSPVDSDIDRLCLSQAQIIRFCVDHRAKLRTDGHLIFFLFRVNTGKGPDYFVASVRVDERGHNVRIHSLDDSGIWFDNVRHHVVLPQVARS